MSFGNLTESGKPVAIKDEGVTLTPAVGSIDFTGSGVSGTAIGTAVTETIGGGNLVIGTTVISGSTVGDFLTVGSGNTLSQLASLSPSTGGTGTTTVFTKGSVVFAGDNGTYSQNNANLFWDNSNNRLGIGTASPGQPVDVSGNLNGNILVRLTNTSNGNSAYAYFEAVNDITKVANVGIAGSATNPYGAILAGNGFIYSNSASGLTIMNEFAGSIINFAAGTSAEKARMDSSGNWGFGTTTVSAKLHALATTEQLRLAYDATHYASFTTASTGNLTITHSNAAAVTFSLPTTNGTNTYALTTDGSGVTSWAQIGLTTAVTGVLPVANGGTNIASYAVGDLLYASGATTLSKLADVAKGSVLIAGGVTTAPAWSSTVYLNTTAALNSARLTVLDTTRPMSLAYDSTNRTDFALTSTGDLVITPISSTSGQPVGLRLDNTDAAAKGPRMEYHVSSVRKGLVGAERVAEGFVLGARAGDLVFRGDVSGATISGDGGATGMLRVSAGMVSVQYDGAWGNPTTSTGLFSNLANAGSQAGRFVGRKSRGTLLSPTTIVNGDYIFAFTAQPYDGTSYVETAGVYYRSNGTVGAGSIPTDIEVYTGSSGSGTLRLLISSGGIMSVSNGRFNRAKGANVTAANDLTLGTDGNTFTITGNTQINAITTANWQAGSKVNLIFTGTPTVKHNTAGGAGTAVLLLAGSGDLVAANNTTLGLLYDGTQWQELHRKVA